MMNNLFSVFEPSASFFLVPNWTSSLFIIPALAPVYWFVSNPLSVGLLKIKFTIHNEMKMLLGPGSFKGSTLMLLGVFFLILFNNFMGLFPLVFTSTSHLAVTLSIALPIWVSFMLYGWFNFTKHMLAHLVPQGTPPALMSFMVVIETVSNLIRPGTLAIRLSANMIAGHLLLTLLGNQTASNSHLILIGLLGTQIMLLLLESAVSIIQSYVFMVLSTLYSSESTSH